MYLFALNTLGLLGMLLILTAFAMNEFGKWSAETFRYDLLNAIGATLLVIYGIPAKVWPFVILNAVWAIIGWRDVVKYTLKSSK